MRHRAETVREKKCHFFLRVSLFFAERFLADAVDFATSEECSIIFRGPVVPDAYNLTIGAPSTDAACGLGLQHDDDDDSYHPGDSSDEEPSPDANDGRTSPSIEYRRALRTSPRLHLLQHRPANPVASPARP